MNKKFQSTVEFIFFIMFVRIMKLFPYSFTRLFLGKLFAVVGYKIGIRKKVAKRQIRKIFPQITKKRLQSLLKKIYYNMGITTAEIYFGKNKKLFKSVSTKGWENLEEAVNMNKGVILASGHFGNWQLAGEYIAQFFNLSVIIKKQRNKYFHDFTYNRSLEEDVTLIDQKKALRPILRLLKNNYIIAVMIDQSAGKRGVQTKFLGHTAPTYVGAAKISLKTGCPVVPAIAFRNQDGSHKLIFEKMILPEEFKNKDRAVVKYLEHISSFLENYIRKYPEQWFWVHRRWKGKKKAKKTLQNNT